MNNLEQEYIDLEARRDCLKASLAQADRLGFAEQANDYQAKLRECERKLVDIHRMMVKDGVK